MRKLGAESVTEICRSAMAEVQARVPLDESPLEAMNSVAFQKGLIFGGGKGPARATLGFRGNMRFGDAERYEGRS
jgi:hypothetical protein